MLRAFVNLTFITFVSLVSVVLDIAFQLIRLIEPYVGISTVVLLKFLI